MQGIEAAAVTVTGGPEAPPEIPDWFRARVRTFAQTAGGTLVAFLVAWLASETGVNLPDTVSGPLAAAVTALIVAGATVVWMVAVQLVSRYAPWAERLFIMRGAPVYVETPRAGNPAAPHVEPGAG